MRSFLADWIAGTVALLVAGAIGRALRAPRLPVIACTCPACRGCSCSSCNAEKLWHTGLAVAA